MEADKEKLGFTEDTTITFKELRRIPSLQLLTTTGQVETVANRAYPNKLLKPKMFATYRDGGKIKKKQNKDLLKKLPRPLQQYIKSVKRTTVQNQAPTPTDNPDYLQAVAETNVVIFEEGPINQDFMAPRERRSSVQRC